MFSPFTVLSVRVNTFIIGFTNAVITPIEHEREICSCFNFFSEVLYPISSKELLINEQIIDKEVRVIGNDGSQLGIMSARDAQKLANEQELDLVKIAPQATPPVCKIMNYGKYRFEQAKREKEAKKNQHVVEVKEIRLSLNIDTHDFETKGNQAMKFLKSGNKIKVSIRFRGREMGHQNIGLDNMTRFAEYCSAYGNIEKPAKLEGRNMLMFLAPKSVEK